MFKRQDKNEEYDLPAKRMKLNSSDLKNNESNKNGDDIWGDDFGDDAIEEMDLIASQAYSQIDVSSSMKTDEVSIFSNCKPSTSKNIFRTPSNISEKGFKSSVNHTANIPNQNIFSNDKPNMQTWNFNDSKLSQNVNMNFKDFEERLLIEESHNSTFSVRSDVVASDNVRNLELNKLKTENNKLIIDLRTKDSETEFLRNQLRQAQTRAANERLENSKLMEKQANQYRQQISEVCKEKEKLQSQLDLQALQLGTLMERCKLLEGKNVRLTEPCTANLVSPMNRNKLCTNSFRQTVSNIKQVPVKDNGIQVSICDKRYYHLKTLISNHSILKISKSIFCTPVPEKSIVDIRIIEKTGKRNLPILREEETARIFENPELVKPIITIINNKKLTTEFILPDIEELKCKSSSELNSDDSIPILNKLISTMQELMLNVIVVLRTISHAMRNDDIRDMNDIYFSEVYSTPIFSKKSVCESNVWHDGERGIEARRVFGVILHIVSESYYLSKYFAGKSKLLVESDVLYRTYSPQMTRYNSWSKKGHDFEALELILEFASLLDLVRRAHQFSGLITAIVRTLCNVHKKVHFCDNGLDYIFRIFKNLVFSRPLALCYLPLTELLSIFVKCPPVLQKLCLDKKSNATSIWNEEFHFTWDACTLYIFTVQIESVYNDPVTLVNIAHALIYFVHNALQTFGIPWKPNNFHSCNCCMKLLRCSLRILYKCSEIDINMIINNSDQFTAIELISRNENSNRSSCTIEQMDTVKMRKHLEKWYEKKYYDPKFWSCLKSKQLSALKDGIQFLCYIATRDPDFISRFTDIEDTFNLFIENIYRFDELIKENEENMMIIKSNFICDKMIKLEQQIDKKKQSRISLDKKSNFLAAKTNFYSTTTMNALVDTEKFHRTAAIFETLF